MWRCLLFVVCHRLLIDSTTLCAGVYGAYLLAVYDAESEEYQTISKCGTGFSEQQLIDLKATLEPHVIKEPKSYYRCNKWWSFISFLCAQPSFLV